MFIKKGEDANLKRLQQGLDTAKFDKSQADTHVDRAEAQRRINRLTREIRDYSG